jgi:hypothetical protein
MPTATTITATPAPSTTALIRLKGARTVGGSRARPPVQGRCPHTRHEQLDAPASEDSEAEDSGDHD